MKIEVYVEKPDILFICGIYGKTTIESLQDIETELTKYWVEPDDEGIYTLECEYNHPEYDKGVYLVHEGGWEFDIIKKETL